MSGEMILIVEDNEVLRQGLQALLESDGYDTLTAMHGVDALGKMKQYTPDLILSDISMPEMDGYTFYQRVREQSEWVSIPFVFLTARRGRQDIFMGKRLGAEDYLVKPVTKQELTSTIRSRLERSQQLLLVQLQHAYSSSLIVLANSIELRDQETRGHVERVRNHANSIAIALGWERPALDELEYGSILHDIGKIHIPVNVLKKPGPLNDEEWKEMRRHPEIGANIIKDIAFLAPAVPVILHHHERWDGGGYPGGFAGEEIPLAARIVAVADSLDAMTTNRPYQRAMTFEQAYNEILRGSGTRYDPNVVRAFQDAWEIVIQEIRS